MVKPDEFTINRPTIQHKFRMVLAVIVPALIVVGGFAAWKFPGQPAAEPNPDMVHVLQSDSVTKTLNEGYYDHSILEVTDESNPTMAI